MSKIRTLVLLLIPVWFLNGCGGAGEDKISATPPTTPAGISVSPADTTLTTDEYGLAGSISVSLSSKPTADVTIPVSSSDTTEGTVDKTSLTFTSTDWSTPQTITVTGVNDTTADGNQNYTIQLGPTTSTATAYNALEKSVSAVNLDIMDGSIAVSPISGKTSESGTTATFTVRLGSAPTAEVTIPITSSNTAEGTVEPSSLLFSTTDWDQYQTVTVTGVGDTSDDGEQFYDIQLAPAVSTDPKYSGLNPADVTVINQSVKRGLVTVSAISGNTDESGKPATFTVQLNIQPAADVEMTITSSDLAKGTVSTPKLTFTNADWAPKPVTVTGVDDSVADNNIPYSIDIGTTSSADDNFNGLTPTPATVSVTNVELVDPYGVTPQISAGYYHNLVLASDGTVWGWGQCANGELDATPVACPGSSGHTLPQRLNITGASAVSTGDSFSAIVKADGSVWTSGVNTNGQLGHDVGIDNRLAQVDGLSNVKTISAGNDFVLALKNALDPLNPNSVWAWGRGFSGQLGNGLTADSQTPVLASGALSGITVTAVAAGEMHSLALDNTGKVYSWGSDGNGQRGLGPTDQSGAVPTAIDLLTNVSTIGAGPNQSFAVGQYNLTADTYGWGLSSDYQLGTEYQLLPRDVPTGVNTFNGTNPIPSQLDGSYNHSLGLVGNQVYAWGRYGSPGVLAISAANPANNINPLNTILVPTLTSFSATATGVSAGREHSLVLLSDGRLQTSGNNTKAQLGTNTTNQTVLIGTYTAVCASCLIGDYNLAALPVYVEDPGDLGTTPFAPFYAYRPVLSGQPASSTTSTSATITVCEPYASQPADYCQDITHYAYTLTANAPGTYTFSDDSSAIADKIVRDGLPTGTYTLLVKGMKGPNNPADLIQTDTSAVNASWTVVAP